MPQTPHVEKHFTSSETIRDVVIGMSDGLTVPFALAAGLSGAVDPRAASSTAGLAEIAAGSIAMGLGGYLAARTDAEHYATEPRARTGDDRESRRRRPREVAEIFHSLRAPGEERLRASPARSARIGALDRFHDAVRTRAREAGPETRAGRAPLTIARLVRRRRADSAGTLFPLRTMTDGAEARSRHARRAPRLRVREGAIHRSRLRSALQTAFVGGLAAAAAFGIAKLIS